MMKFDEFNDQNKIEKQPIDLKKKKMDKLEKKKREIRKKMNVWVNGSSAFD